MDFKPYKYFNYKVYNTLYMILLIIVTAFFALSVQFDTPKNFGVTYIICFLIVKEILDALRRKHVTGKWTINFLSISDLLSDFKERFNKNK